MSLSLSFSQGTTLQFEDLCEFEIKFEKFLGYESGIQMGSIHEKILCYCPFKAIWTDDSKNIFG
jgi:hypothetical protein